MLPTLSYRAAPLDDIRCIWLWIAVSGTTQTFFVEVKHRNILPYIAIHSHATPVWESFMKGKFEKVPLLEATHLHRNVVP